MNASTQCPRILPTRLLPARILLAAGLCTFAVTGQAFAAGDEEAPFEGEGAISAETLEARKNLIDLAKARRETVINLSFEDFMAGVFREPGPDGKFIVNGDTAIANEKLLREYFDQLKREARQTANPEVPELIVHQVGGLYAAWSSSEKRALSYCISLTFGSRHGETVTAMADAAAAWEAAGDVKFIHKPDHDADCTPDNSNVVFDVRPVSGGNYLARAFFPNNGRRARNVLIDDSSYTLNPAGKLSLTGILRHELGHALGFRHEHTRPDSGTCFEDRNWRPITNYDEFSTMHYPQCNGAGDWSLNLTHLDQNGIACLYGPAPGFVVDTGVCTPPGSGPMLSTLEFKAISVVAGQEWVPDGLPVDVRPGSTFTTRISGSGDGDLYVKFDAPANRADYDCRPYSTSSNEECIVDVPASASKAHVMVRGYEAAAFDLTIEYSRP